MATPRRVFTAPDRKSLKAAVKDEDVPSYVTVSDFFETIARSLLALEDRVMELEARLRKSH